VKKARSWKVTFGRCESCGRGIEKDKHYACLCLECVEKKQGVMVHLHRNAKEIELLCRDDYIAYVEESDAKLRVILEVIRDTTREDGTQVRANKALLLMGKRGLKHGRTKC
jgi:hypothetical protein